jgi:histidinol-phosphate aminotransferase
MASQLQRNTEIEAELLERGYNRRDLGRIAAIFGAGAIAASAGRPAWAAAAAKPPAKLLLDSNECWTGPMAAGIEAARDILSRCNRYEPGTEREDFIRAVMAVDGVGHDQVSPWPGSSDPLSRSVVSFCSPTRGVVAADPTFELVWETAEWLGVPLRKVPLTADYRHDVKAMLAADPQAGLYYVCSPNNPTGTITPLEDIAWLVANKPAGAKVLVDEAYIHFTTLPSAATLLSKSEDVIVLRTFSKLFGMAGMRMGYALSHSANIAKMQRYDGDEQSGSLPIPSLVCATASLRESRQIALRRSEMEANLAFVSAELRRRGFEVLPSSANMVMVDWRGNPAKEMREAIRNQGVAIGRSWAIWPGRSRITVSSRGEMIAFLRALDRVLQT